MKTSKLSRLLALVLALVLALGCLMPISAVQSQDRDEVLQSETFSGEPTTLNRLDETGEPVEIMVMLDGQTEYVRTGDLELANKKAPEQLATLKKAELTIESTLSSQIEVENFYSLFFNGFSFTGEEWMVEAINEIPGYSAFVTPMLELIEPTVDEATPSMDTSTTLVTATKAWSYGYTGEGMVVAILDTGIRQTHEAFSVMPENTKIDEAYLKNVYAKYGDKIHAGNGEYVDGMYYSAKLPFNWDYFDNDPIPNHVSSDHGTHVAGIAAGNNGDDFKGVAPDAQIMTMQVFNADGGAAFSTLMLALEDCVYLGADVANMSLGVAAGYSDYEFISSALGDVYGALENAGITVAAAAGNDRYAYQDTNMTPYLSGSYAWPSTSVDYGIIGAPASFVGSFSVASVNNTDPNGMFYLSIHGFHPWNPTTIAGIPTLTELGSGEYDITYVGLGSPEEIEAAGGLEGKIALVRRGTLTFDTKLENAKNAGAIAVLLFNNVDGDMSPGITYKEIPLGILGLQDGEEILSSMTNNQGKIDVVNDFSYGSITMASSSSWGTTSDLRIAPEISAPGGGINSAIGFEDDDSYEAWGGTSMATPHIAGALLLVKERLREIFPDLSAKEINDLAYKFLMSTAHQVRGFVRQQGAGLIDLGSALTTDAYLSVPGEQRTKLELDDSMDGSFSFTFEVTNIGDSTKTYTIDYSALTEKVSDLEYSGTTEYDPDYAATWYVKNPTSETIKTICGAVLDVTDLCEIDAPETVVVPAGKTVKINMTISCTDELMEYFEENCPAGMYLEGFVKLIDTDEKGVDLSIPYLGFVGDWDYPSILDDGYWWMKSFGVNNLQQSVVSYYRYVGFGTLEQGLGLNYYADATGETYLDDRNAISPNGDGLLDAVDYLEFSILRNPRTVKLYVEDAEGNVIEKIAEGNYYRKEYYVDGFNGGMTYTSFTFDLNGDQMEENETVYLVLESWLDHEGYTPEANASGYWRIPVTKDTIAPAVEAIEGGIEILDANYIAYYAVYADEAKTELLFEDGVFAMERGVSEQYLTELDTYYVFTADYARNEAFYKVENGTVTDLGWKNEFDERSLIMQEHMDYAQNYYEYGWIEVDPDRAAGYNRLTEPTYEQTEVVENHGGYDIFDTAVGVDGTLYATDGATLYTMDPDTLEMTKRVDFWSDSHNPEYSMLVYTVLFNPETWESFAYATMRYDRAYNCLYFCSLDLETGEVEPLWYDGRSGTWAIEFLDGDTLIGVNQLFSQFYYMDYKTGAYIQKVKTGLQEPIYYGDAAAGAGYRGDLLLDRERNILYLSTNYSWFRKGRYNAGGIIEFNLTTGENAFHTIGNGKGLVAMGMFIREDVKPQDFYATMTLIDAIGEVTYESGDAIRAAREAYNNLSEKDKARIENYEDLLNAEHRYAIVKAEHSSYLVSKFYANLILSDLENFNTSDLNAHQLDLFNEAVESFKAVLAEAKTSEEIAAALEALFAVIDNLDTLCPSAEFSDVDAKAWYHEAIDYAVGNGLMNGMGDGTFAPNAEMTRAQLVTVLYRMAGSPSVEGIENPFKDVAENAWFVDAVLWAAANGIVNGTSADTFSPNAAATREQFVTILYRYTAGEAVEDDKLADVPDADRISDYAREAMNWAVANGLIQGDDKGQVNPLNSATRAEIATLLMRFCESN